MDLRPTSHIVDDDPHVRTLLCRMCTEHDIEAVPYASGLEFLEESSDPPAGCVVLDLRMPGLSGEQTFEEIQNRKWTTPVIVLTGHADVSVAVSMMKRGVFDFVQKPGGTHTIVTKIRYAFEYDRKLRQQNAEKIAAHHRWRSLSGREQEIAGMIMRGHLSKQIAHKLGISRRTVDTHRASIMRKTAVDSVPELMALAIKADAYQA